MIKKYDLVKIVNIDIEDEIALTTDEIKQFEGSLAIVMDVTDGDYELVYVGGSKLNALSEKAGGILWNESELELI